MASHDLRQGAGLTMEATIGTELAGERQRRHEVGDDVAAIELVDVAKVFSSRHGDVHAVRLGAPPQVNVMGTPVFVGGLLLLVNMSLLRRRRV